MSIEDALTFIDAAGQPGELQTRVGALRGAGSLDRLRALGEEVGLSFTIEEYREAVVKLAEGELSDAELEGVLRDSGLPNRLP